jgi:hypothetical protein
MPRDWWPLSDADPVPGDPEALAGLGRHWLWLGLGA